MKSVAYLAAVFALVFVLENPAAGQEGIKWHDDVEAARAQAAREGKLVLIHFWNERCGPCKKLDVTVFPDENVAAAVHQSYVPVKVNTDRNRALTASLKVDRIPQDVLMTADGNVLTKQISPNRANLYVNFVNSVATYAQTQRPQQNPIAQASAQTAAAPQQHPLEERRFGTARSDRDSVPVIRRGQIDPQRELAESPANPTNFQITDRAGPTDRGAALANQSGQGFQYPQMPQAPNRALEGGATNLASRQPPIYTSQVAPRRWDGQATASPDAPNFERPTAPTGPSQSFPEQTAVGNPYADQRPATVPNGQAQGNQSANRPLDLRNPRANVPYQGQIGPNQTPQSGNPNQAGNARQVNNPNAGRTYENPTIQSDANRSNRTLQSPESFRQNTPLASNRQADPRSNGTQRPSNPLNQQGTTPDPRVIRPNAQNSSQTNGLHQGNQRQPQPRSPYQPQIPTDPYPTQQRIAPSLTSQTPNGITPGYARAPLDESNPYRRAQPNVNPSHLPPQQVPSNQGLNVTQFNPASQAHPQHGPQSPPQAQNYQPRQPSQGSIPIVTADQYRDQQQPYSQSQGTQPRAPRQGGVSFNSSDMVPAAPHQGLTQPTVPSQEQHHRPHENQPLHPRAQVQQPNIQQQSAQMPADQRTAAQQPATQRPTQGLVQPNLQQPSSPAIGVNRPASVPQQPANDQTALQANEEQPRQPPAQPQQQPTQQQPSAETPTSPAQPQQPSDSSLPSVAMDGFCPVTLVEHRSWQKGDKAHGCIHRGRLYLFTSAENRDRFLQHPDRFAPMLSGYDPVIYAEENRLVEGKREHGVFSGGRVYMFANEDTLISFREKIDHYTARSFEAMGLPMERMAEETDHNEVNR